MGKFFSALGLNNNLLVIFYIFYNIIIFFIIILYMSSINFFGTKSDIDEEQARQRHLQYLRVASQNSAMKEAAEFETESLQPQIKPITEILSDEAELSRVLQEYLGKILISPDGRQKGIDETDDFYQQRVNPIIYVMSRINPEEKKLILTNFQQILTDTQNIKMLPSDFISYIQNYQRLYRETGGVKGFPNTSAIIAEIRALRQMLPDTRQLQRSINNLRGAQAVMKRDLKIENRQLNTLLTDAVNRLQNLEGVVGNIDYDRIQELINTGVQDIAQGNRIVADNVYARLTERLERLPTRQEIETIDRILSRQLEGIAKNVREGRAQSQADKAEILAQLDNAFTQIDSVLMDKVNLDDLREINAILKTISEDATNIEASTREIQREMQRNIEQGFEGTKEYRDIYNEKLQNLIDLGNFEPNDPQLIQAAKNATIGELNMRRQTGRGVHATFAKKKIQPKMSLISGKGIRLDDGPKFIEFGKYVLNNNKLNERQLDAKTLKSGTSVNGLSNIKISEDFYDILNDMIDTQKINEKHVNRLSSNEKRIFSKLINGSGLYGKYKIKLVPSEQEQKENERYEMLKGIFTAGNDSQEVIRELKQLILKFINDGRLPRREGLETLYELNVMSV